MAIHPRTQALHALGQSLWLDYMRRDILDGELQRLIAEDAVSGVTANPTIFEKAIAESDTYDTALGLLASTALDPNGLYETLAISDITRACDLLRPTWERSSGRDGFVSLEVAPELANDTAGTLAEVRRFWRRVERPNLLIKIPGTPAGVPAVRTALTEGINVNITLLFSVAQYQAVADAYLDALEARLAAGKPIDRLASVASFFVSRVDTLVDKKIDAAPNGQKEKLLPLRGKIGIANAKLAWERYQEITKGARWQALAAKGARPQRVLWASTSTKDPRESDVKYVEALAGPDTIDTLPPETLAAFAAHGEAAPRLLQGLAETKDQVARLEAGGISLAHACDELQREGVEKFTASIVSLRNTLAKKSEALRQKAAKEKRPPAGATDFALGPLEAKVEEEVRALGRDGFVARLWKRDPTLWKLDPRHEDVVRHRLGWLDVAERMVGELPRLAAFVKALRGDGFTHAVLLGMGGSSLAPEVYRATFGVRRGHLDVQVLDSTSPEAVRAAERSVDLRKTLFLVSSKSGGTLETLSLFRYFHFRVADKLGTARAGGHFAAITDPGSGLEKLARDCDFREIFLNPSDIGGRYSALSLFGLVPAALGGVPVEDVVARALAMAQACGTSTDPWVNPGLRLGVALAEAGKAGRDKVTLVAPPSLASFGAWAEQLIAESTGKEGKGLVPVDREPQKKGANGQDRLWAALELGKKGKRELAGPAVALHLADSSDLGAEFFRWEFATAVAGALLGIDAFDEPNVQESKDNTNRLLGQLHARGEAGPSFAEGGLEVWSGVPATDLMSLWNAFFAQVPARGYLSLQAYLPPSDGLWDALTALRAAFRDATGRATTLAWGPRFLHSTGQLHKGGPQEGCFVQLVADHPADLPIPGAPYSFGQLIGAQADGDMAALRQRSPRVVRVKLGKDLEASIEKLRKSVEKARR